MDPVLSIALIVHVLPAVFWAGSTFVVAHGSAENARHLFRSQMGAGAVTILAGGYLMSTGMAGAFVMWGAAAAIVAYVVQIAMVAPVLGKLPGDADAAKRAITGNRIAAVLLALAIIGMVVR